ncbi:MAG: M20/M25/M40 family metallo-hydrolase [Acidobacteriaceae bacterium]|nr:M20/M25/M40 family metallo-hydrolase [Acidobacteriaceae bacterium]
MRRIAALLFLSTLCLKAIAAQDANLDTVHRIKMEAFDNSKVMEQLYYLADRYGPRLTASPEFDQAADWAVSRLKEYGLANVHTEKWGPFGRSWSLQTYTLEMTAPRYSHLVAAPLAWSAPTHGTESGDVLYAPVVQPANRFDMKAQQEAFQKYKTQWHGKLKGKIVLVSEPVNPPPSTKPLFRRYTDAELAEIAQAPEPSLKRNIGIDELKVPENQEEASKYFASLPNSVMDELFDRYEGMLAERGRFLRAEGVLGVITADRRAHNGLLFAEAAGSHESKDPLAPATFVVTEEQYSRLTRLAEKKEPVTMRMNVDAKYSNSDVDGQDIIGEIPGQTKQDEVVMVGAHFDSWHTGTGATDNGAGSAVMIEVMRILKTLNLKMNRTVRIGLWSGEEQGLYGSKAYVKAHFADPKTMEVKPDHAKLDVYLNLDNGSGKIRGVYLQGNDAARPLFDKYMQPFHDMGVTTITLKNTGGTDHLSFDDVGLPGFQFIQDPLDYGTVTHHSDMDTYQHAIPEDLMQASAVIAALVYDFANRDEMVPRKPLPVVPSKGSAPGNVGPIGN